jgi:hypothetical protein
MKQILEITKEDMTIIPEEKLDEITIELMSWDTWKDIFYALKIWFGFKFLRWFKPKGYDYGYFIDPLTVVCKLRDNDKIIHTFMQTSSEKDGVDIIKK